MKLKFLLSGGSFLPRYSVYEPYIIPETEETSAASKSSKSKSGDTNTTEILKMIRESFKDGLPSDLQAASSTIAAVFGSIELKLNNPDLYGGTGSIARDYAKALPLLKSIEFNRKEYESAYKTLTEKGGMKEVAINSLGQIAVQSEEGFGWISPEEYHNDRESYIPITNAQLLDLRANETSLAFKNNVFETINNGVGIETITKLILEVVDKIGKEEHVRTGYGYVSGGNLLKDYKEFEKNMRQYGFDPKKDDLYSYEVSTSSERANALAMLNIVYGMLPASSKALLQYKTNGTDLGAIGMIHTLLQASSDLTLKETIKLENGVSHSSSNKKSGDGSDDKYFNHAFRAIMGLGREEDFVINPGTVNKFSVRGNTVPLMVNDQKIIDKNLLSEAQNSAFGKMMDTDNISVAGQHVNPSVANKIFLNSKLTTLMDLPYTLDDLGNIIPDYKLLEEKDIVDKQIRDNKWTFKDNYKQIQEFINKEQLSIRYYPTGEVKFPNVKKFMVFNVQFPEEVFEDGKILNAKYVKKLSDHDATNTYKAILQYNNWSEKDWKQDTDALVGSDDFYASTVVIPVKASFENMLDKPVDESTVMELMEKDKEMRERDEKYDYDDRHIGK